jgi:hypothetical protein
VQANSDELSSIRHFGAFAAGTVHLKKPSVGPKGLIGPPCHGAPGRRRQIKKYIKIFLLAVVVVISIKPFLFTWNFILANFHLEKNNFKAGAYIANTLSYKSSVYRVFNKYSPTVIEKYLVKSAIYNNDKKPLETYPRVIPFSAIQEQFNDNFYFQQLLGNIHKKKDWQCLDEVSLALLADPQMSQRTIAIFEKIASSFDKNFIINLADFASWKGNISLCDYLVSTYALPSPFKSVDLMGVNYNESVSRLKKVMWAKHKLRANRLGENLVQCSGFADPGCTEKKWYFSRMFNGKNFSRGSFFMGTDKIGESKNPVIRIIGFFISHDSNKSEPRAGVRCRKRIAAENGFYVFGFDYCTITGKERPSFYLSKGIEKRIPSTQRQWKKVIFILNNAFNDYDYLSPLIRMWGTGTLLVDNVFLSKTMGQEFSIIKPYVLYIEDSPGAPASSSIKNEGK